MMKKNDLVLLRGACDVTAISYYLRKKKNIFIENCIKGKYLDVAWDLSNSIFLMQAAKKEIIDHPFVEPAYYPSNELFNGHYKYIVLSTISDGIMGVYENRVTHEKIAYGNCAVDATYDCGSQYFDSHITHGGIPSLTKDKYSEFAKEYIFKGRITVEECVSNFLVFCGAVPKSTKIVFLLGTTIPNIYGENNPAMLNSGAKFYGDLKKELHKRLEVFENVLFVDPDDYYQTPKRKADIFFYNYPTLNHYPCLTYFKMARALEKYTEGNVSASWFKYWHKKVKRMFATKSK